MLSISHQAASKIWQQRELKIWRNYVFLTAKSTTQSLDTTEEILVFVCLVVIDVMVKQSRAELLVEQNGRGGWCRSSSKRGDGGTVCSTMSLTMVAL